MSISPGDRVRIVEGTYEGSEGQIVKVGAEPDYVVVLVPIFGHPTPLHFRPEQVQRV